MYIAPDSLNSDLIGTTLTLYYGVADESIVYGIQDYCVHERYEEI